MQWSGAGIDQRPALERQMELLMSKMNFEIRGREEQFRQQLKRLLTPGQYHEVIVKGRDRSLERNAAVSAEAVLAGQAALEKGAADNARRATTRPSIAP